MKQKAKVDIMQDDDIPQTGKKVCQAQAFFDRVVEKDEEEEYITQKLCTFPFLS